MHMPDDRQPVLRIALPAGRVAQVYAPTEGLWGKLEGFLRGEPVRSSRTVEGESRTYTALEVASWPDSDSEANIGLFVMELVVVECTDLPTMVTAGGPPAWPVLVGRILETWPESASCYYWKCVVRTLVQRFVDQGRSFAAGFDNSKVKEQFSIDARASAEQFLSDLKKRSGRQEAEAEQSSEDKLPPPPFEPADLVTLDEAAAMVHRKKRTLERRKTKGALPPPRCEGGGGKPDLWDWKTLRPCLQEEFKVILPPRFPGNAR
jgi:hypothetical protein